MDGTVNALPASDPAEAAEALLDLYDDALPQVHGYLSRRCRGRLVAEELTSEVFLAAVRATKAGKVQQVTVAWLIGIARHKLVDHWRAEEREQRRLRAVAGQIDDEVDAWEAVVDRHLADEVLATLAPQYRAALTLRYLDALPVAAVAEHLERTVGATEALLTRSKAAFRQSYEQHGGHDV
ncbi:MAG: sigma-70 family RNA polymerase sigma factor [Actinomycetota bacterium]